MHTRYRHRVTERQRYIRMAKRDMETETGREREAQRQRVDKQRDRERYT